MSGSIWVSARNADGRTFTVGGDTYDDFCTNALALFGPEGADQLAGDFSVLLDPPSAQPSQPAQPPASAPSAAPASAPGAPTCAHGARTFRSGTGKKGPWTAWFCPEPKGAVQCEAIWG